MKTTTFNLLKSLLSGVFFLWVAFAAYASPDAESKESIKEEEFEASELIFHHIKDSHGFHVAGDFSIALPVILWTDNGLVTFMSSEFHHDNDGEVVVEKNGMKFVNLHEKIYQLEAGASSVSLDHEHHPTNAHRPLDFSITKNVFSMLLSLVVMLLLFSTAARSYKKSQNHMPSGFGRFVEPVIVFVRDEIAIPNIGEHHYKRYMPFLLTLFFFIWLNNIFGLIPFFPFSANLSGNIAFTGTLALITLLITWFSSKKSYWKHMVWMPGLPVPMKLFLAPIELMGMFIKPIALMIRLFANITAGHVVVLSLISLIFVLKTAWAGTVSVPFAVFISVIEVLVVAIQAYIFTMLSALYFGQALEEEH
ncbi:MAG TPA: F0F1 ATP synthase subunit A [Flavobacteriaceae bacterium]|nr:F0F1 ATP synthase subunit A [Flavobacteriaceae bacterium]MCB9211899.1 F0F1 ATP synthase subunit A [Alteromonas sp.]HPF10007.1 F0F1 ATP synthase subunit A [Flavobacteriaceae bacterium]HQU22353.1 F0F1 ATP synthase subunit A [Flavobacteriaceae bacterium]HQU63910.1 F0F1 ATP synthase subunit A [Flavobacteriaceae bacterium]